MWPNPQETMDLATFTEKILIGKLLLFVQCKYHTRQSGFMYYKEWGKHQKQFFKIHLLMRWRRRVEIHGTRGTRWNANFTLQFSNTLFEKWNQE